MKNVIFENIQRLSHEIRMKSIVQNKHFERTLTTPYQCREFRSLQSLLITRFKKASDLEKLKHLRSHIWGHFLRPLRLP